MSGFYLGFQIGRGITLLLDRQPEIVAQLQGHVASGDPPLLSQHARLARRMQERSSLHVLRRDLFVLLQGSQSVYAVRPAIIATSSLRAMRSTLDTYPVFICLTVGNNAKRWRTQ